ncbi:MAG: NADP-dependent phosphogluconate dehydrogenase, partial [Spirochaetia bacterium]
MKIGFVGLGRMGGNMVQRLLKDNHEVVAFDVNEEARKQAQAQGAAVFDSLEKLAGSLDSPRSIWVMVPAGKPTEDTIRTLGSLLSEGDILIDGGNSNFRDSMRRAHELEKNGISFLDAGTSGGVWGLEIGYCMMIGGNGATFRKVEPIFETLAPKDGYAHVGPNGAGHFVKMVHNGIEYALLQAYGE